MASAYDFMNFRNLPEVSSSKGYTDTMSKHYGIPASQVKADKYYNDIQNAWNLQSMAYNSAEAQKNRDFNSYEALKAREWEERMSNTSHQREVQDLKLAGLNPVLSANQGANSYTTSSANSSSAGSLTPSNSQALASLYGQLKSTRMSNNTNLQIAKWNREVGLASAAATRAAASMNAGATLGAAATAAQASMYATDNQKSGSLAGIVDKYITKYGLTDKAIDKIKKFLN